MTFEVGEANGNVPLPKVILIVALAHLQIAIALGLVERWLTMRGIPGSNPIRGIAFL